MTIAYRGEGAEKQPGCTLQAHYIELQAIGDALGFGAQRMQSDELEKMQSAEQSAGEATASGMEDVAEFVRLAEQHRRTAECWYGVFLGVRGVLRAVEGNTSELSATEQEMLGRIDWSMDPPRFLIPGFEHIQREHNAEPETPAEPETQA